MLKELVPSLISSGLAALVGALVGGWITFEVVSRDTRIKLVADSYSTYLAEAVPVLIVSHEGRIGDEDRKRIAHAVGVLTLTASEEVLCWAFAFEKEVTSGSPDATAEFTNLWLKMREEVLGKESGVDNSSEECSWLPF